MPDPSEPITHLADDMGGSRPEPADAHSADGRFPSGFGPAHLDIGGLARTAGTDPLGVFDPHHAGGSDHADPLSPFNATVSGSLSGSGGGITIGGPLPDFPHAPPPIPPEATAPVAALPVPAPLQLAPPAILAEHHGELPASAIGHIPSLHLDPVSLGVPGTGIHPPALSPSILDPAVSHQPTASPHDTPHGHGGPTGAVSPPHDTSTSQLDQGGHAASPGGIWQDTPGTQQGISAGAASSHNAPSGQSSAPSPDFAAGSGGHPTPGSDVHDGGAAAGQLGFA